VSVREGGSGVDGGRGITLRGMNTPPTAVELAQAAAAVAQAYAAVVAAAYAAKTYSSYEAAAAAAIKYADEAAAQYERAKAGK